MRVYCLEKGATFLKAVLDLSSRSGRGKLHVVTVDHVLGVLLIRTYSEH